MKIYILQVMSILTQAYCSPQYLYFLVPDTIKTIKKEDGTKEQIVLIRDKQEFIKQWNSAKEILYKTVKILKNPRDYGAITSEFIPYPSIIPAFAAIRKSVESVEYKNKIDISDKIRKWYWASVFQNRYSSAVESTSAKDFQDLKKWFKSDDNEPECIAEFIGEFRNYSFKDEKKGSAIYNAIYNVLVLNEARDWETFELPEYDTLNDHHIIPYSWGKEKIGSDINSILNRTPLCEATNKNVIGSDLPNYYIKRMLDNNENEKVYKVLESHLISKKAVEVLLRNPFKKDDYYEFINLRQKEIISAIEEKLIKDFSQLTPRMNGLNNLIEKVELKLREILTEKLGVDNNSYKKYTPQHVQQKVQDRIKKEIKKNPSRKEEEFENFRKRLDYYDLQEYQQLIVGVEAWQILEKDFGTKESLTIKFNQLAELRNSIRHSRDIDEVTIKEGEAAILWFSKVLKINI